MMKLTLDKNQRVQALKKHHAEQRNRVRILRKPMNDALRAGVDPKVLQAEVDKVCASVPKSRNNGREVHVEILMVREIKPDVYEIHAVDSDKRKREWKKTGNRHGASMFKLEYSGTKAPAHFDIFKWGRKAWNDGTGFLYMGLFECRNLATEIAIYTCGRQFCGTELCRYKDSYR